MKPLSAPLLLLAAMPCWLSAQDCAIPFTAPLFEVQEEAGVIYGSAPTYSGGSTELALNLYKPVGDGQTERPLVVVIHGGGFSAGYRDEMNELCQGLAGAGWAAATISYRLGFYGNGLLDPPWIYDPAEAERAMYRAMQDAKGAIRFLKGRHELDSTSTTNIFVIGFSAGAITALELGFLVDPAQKPASCGAIGDVQHFLDFFPRPDLGSVDGALNHNGYDASVRGLVSIFGAIADTAWITTEGPALYTYHQILDPLVACGHDRLYWGLGLGIPDNYPYMYGSCSIDQRMQHLNPEPGHYLYHPYPGNAHDIHDPAAVLLEATTWMRNLFCPLTTGQGNEPNRPAFTLYPNPTDGFIQVSPPPHTALPYTLHDALGRRVKRGWLNGTPLDLSEVPNGVYWLCSGSMGTGQPVVIQR